MSDRHDGGRTPPAAVRRGVETPTAGLRREHQVILRVVDVLDAIVAEPDPRAWSLNDLDRCIDFFRLFTDACHHGQEEDVLFPALDERPGPGVHELIGIMREEHRQGRGRVAAMRDALTRLRAGAPAADGLRAAAAEYSDLIRAHIEKEDGGLFDMADHLIEAPASRAVRAACELVCRRRFDGFSLAGLEAMASELALRHATPSRATGDPPAGPPGAV